MNNNIDSNDNDDSFIVYIDNIDDDHENSEILSDTSSVSSSDTYIVYSSDRDTECYTDDPIYDYYKSHPKDSQNNNSTLHFISRCCITIALMCMCIHP